jgi:hypothetical protein
MQRPSVIPSGPFRLIHAGEAVVVAEVGPLCVVIWRGAVTKNPFEWQRAGLDEVVKRHPRGAAFLCVVEQSAKPPGEELRRASTQMVQAHGEHLKAVACVIEGDGFKAAIGRGALASMILLLRNKKSPVSVFAQPREALRWTASHIPVGSVEELTKTIEAIRSKFPEPEQNM